MYHSLIIFIHVFCVVRRGGGHDVTRLCDGVEEFCE